jgi:hypothetical protein
VALAALPVTIVYWRAGRLTPLRGLGLVAAFVVAFGLGTALGLAAIQPLRSDPANYDFAEIVVAGIGGLVGGAVSLAAFPLLGLAERSLVVARRIAVSAVVLAAVAAFVAAMPFFTLVAWNSAMLWLAAAWQLVYALLLGWVVRPGR